jgi:hypothetical protein
VTASALLWGRARYERVMEGWVDDAPHALAITVSLADPERGLAVSVLALPSPSYEIREARGRTLAGDVEPSVLDGIRGLAGTPMVAGLTRRVRERIGGGPAAALALDAVIEVARLARQVIKLPREQAERAAADGPRGFWELDQAGWADLPDSCFTYSAAARPLFASRAVTTTSVADVYSPRPGQRRVFERRKVARLEPVEDRLLLFHSMHDNAHGFELTYEAELASGRILRAESRTPRLPYMGICSEPQARIAALVGETLDAGLPRRIQSLLGGVAGCAQLYDLTSDLLKLLGPLPPAGT